MSLGFENLDIRLSESCASCVFFKGSWHTNAGRCEHPALAPRPTRKNGYCNGHVTSVKQVRFLQQSLCSHIARLDVVGKVVKGKTDGGVGKITLVIFERCGSCWKKLGTKSQVFYEYELDKFKRYFTTKYSEEYVMLARRLRKYVKNKPVPVFTQKKKGPN